MDFKGKLKRPIAVFDLETTGLDVDNDEILQISIQRINIDGTIEQYKSYVMATKESHPEALAVHGITMKKLKEENAPSFKEITPKIIELLEGADLSGKNIKKFDIPMLESELRNKSGIDIDFSEGVIFDVEDVIRKAFSHSLTNIYEILTGEERPDDAHDAHADTRDTIIVLGEIINKFNIGETQEEWVEYAKNKHGKEMVDYAGKFYRKDGVVYFNFGNDINKAVETNPGLLEWMQTKPFFNRNTLNWVDKLLNGIYYPEVEEKTLETIDKDKIGSVEDLID